MNREEVEKYIQEAMTLKLDAIKKLLRKDWPQKYKKHFELFPKKLYKYVPLNDYYIDAINNNYVYLCPAKKLDDQFECRVDFPIEKILKNRQIIDEKFIEALADKVSDYPSCFDKKKMKEIIKSCLDKDKRPNLGKVSLALDQNGNSLSEKDKETTLKVFAAIMTGAWMSDSAEQTMKYLITKASNAQDEIGIGSLTENHKSQVMWEMYGNHYRGICIEYDFTKSIDAMINTFPVVYGDKKQTNLILILIGIFLDSIYTYMSKGKTEILDSAKDYIKLFITKYDEWSFQKEWRIIGQAGIKFPIPKIKKIYMGKNISLEDKEKLQEIARHKNIQLYKQLDNFESLEIEYEKIN